MLQQNICLGCDYANQIRELEQGLERRRPYCRHPSPKSQGEANQDMMVRQTILSHSVKWVPRMLYDEGIMKDLFNIGLRQLRWGILVRIMNYRVRIAGGKL